jgi:photosynthetic reaction center H subunit
MGFGAFTSYFDVAQVVLYAFWIFFAGLIIYLRREDKREGYPLESDRSQRSARVKLQGFPRMPSSKSFTMPDGSTVTVPRAPDSQELAARPLEPWPGAPLEPTGNPMLDGVGPASYAQRDNVPELTFEGHPRMVPMRRSADFTVSKHDPDPRGMPVLGGDGQQGGVVYDLWVDAAEPQIRYVEVMLNSGTHRVLVPIGFVRIHKRRRVARVRSILGAQFASAPVLANPEQITRAEEDRVCAYYGGGTLYARDERAEPLL